MIGRLVGPYRITEKIGEGGMGSVFRGIDTMLEREVAIKMLRPELSSQPHVVERFRTEAVTLARLNHPNIATLFSFLREGDDYFMVMEYVKGESLDDVIRKFGAISCDRAIPLFCQALDGIDHAHRMGIIHRDIKPANIMLTETGSIKVMDFGIARVLGSARLTRQGNVVGTIEYMSPEQIKAEESDARSDVYSLGVLLYEMLTGRVPFTSTSEYELMKAQIEQAPPPPRNFAASIPLAVEQAIMRALAKKIEARFQTAGEMRIALMTAQGMATSSMNVPAGYAAPTTKVMELPNVPRPTDVSGGDTRIVGSEFRDTGSRVGSSTDPGGSDFRQTRAADSGEMPAATRRAANAATLPDSAVVSTALPPAVAPVGSRRMSWKIYLAVAAMVVLAVGVPYAFIKAKARATQPPAEVESVDVQQAPANSLGSSPTPSVETSEKPGLADSSGADPNSNSKSKNARLEKTDPTADANANVNANSDSAVTSKANVNSMPTAQTSNANSAVASHKDSNAIASTNANTNKNEKKKGGGIGGFFKKVFGGGEEKKPETKQK